MDFDRHSVRGPDLQAQARAQAHWNSIAKPVGSLGLLEKLIIRIAGIQRTEDVDISRKAVAVLCADNGVVEEGVTQTGSEVTAVVTENFAKGITSVNAMARAAGAEVVPVDIGVSRKIFHPGVLNRKVAFGTKNITREAAMSPEEVRKAVKTGMELVRELKERGCRLIATGEMGIGNTTTSSAVACVLLGQSAQRMTGRGAGLTDSGLIRKICAVEKAIAVNRPDPENPLDVLQKVGGLDLAGLAGVFLGGAVYEVPVVADGFISVTAALAAVRLCPACREYILPSHLSREPGARMVTQALGMEPVIHGELSLGEGTGAVALFPLLDMALAVYRQNSTFEKINIPAYEVFNKKAENEPFNR